MQIKISIFSHLNAPFPICQKLVIYCCQTYDISDFFFEKKTPESISDFLKWHHDNQ